MRYTTASSPQTCDINDFKLDDDTLVLTDHMTELQKVELKFNLVRLSHDARYKFVNSLPSVKHDVDITIKS